MDPPENRGHLNLWLYVPYYIRKELNMLESFYAFNNNAVSNLLYVIQTNSWFVLLLLGVLGIISLNMKAEIDMAVNEEQNVI